MRVFLLLVTLLGLSIPIAEAEERNVTFCDGCSVSQKEFAAKSMVSSGTKVVQVADRKAEVIDTYRVKVVVFNEPGLETTQKFIAKISNTASLLNDFNKYIEAWKQASEPFVLPPSVVSSPWDVVGDATALGRIMDYVNSNKDISLAGINVYNAVAKLTGKLQPVSIRLKTADGGSIVIKVEKAMIGDDGFVLVGEIDFKNSVDGKGQSIKLPNSGELGMVYTFDDMVPRATLNDFLAACARAGILIHNANDTGTPGRVVSCQVKDGTVKCKTR